MKTSVVIPVLNAERYLPSLIAAIGAQDTGVAEMILVDSGSNDRTRALAALDSRTRVLPLPRFSHGRARNLGTQAASGDVVVFLSQDALPRDAGWLRELLHPFQDPRVAAAYSRQVPRPDVSPMERFFIETRFPEQGRLQERPVDGPVTLEAAFFSNVSSAVRRDVLERHPFDETLVMSEDQKLSRELLEAGRAVAYAPKSVVIHSHDYGLGDVFRRYLDSVHSLTEIFPRHDLGTSARLGLPYLAREVRHIVRRHPRWLPYYACYVAAKSLGVLAGHGAKHLPPRVVRRVSLHGGCWEPPRRQPHPHHPLERR